MATKRKAAKTPPRLNDRITFRPGVGDVEIIEGIKRKQGLETDSTAIRWALRFTGEGLGIAKIGEGFAPRQIEPRSAVSAS